MENKTSFELKKDKFEYEVKEFVPVIRKNKRSRKFKIIAGVVAALLVVLVGVGLYKTFIYREKLTPEEACKRALTDCVDHAFGRESYIVQDLEAADWFDLLTEGCYEVDASIKLKELADLGLGIESYLSGAGIKTSTKVNMQENKLVGSLDVTWAILTIPIAEYEADSEKIVISSPEFVEENILVNKGDLDFTDSTIAGIYKELTGEEMQESPYTHMEIGEILDLAQFECKYSQIDDAKKVVAGKEETCYGYKIEAVSELLVNPIEFILYVDRDYRLISLDVSYSYKTEEGLETGLEFSFDFSGQEHPTDKISSEFLLFAGEDKIQGEFVVNTLVGEEKIETTLEGKLNVPGYEFYADVLIEYDKTKDTFFIDADAGSQYGTADFEAEGSVENDNENGNLKIDVDRFTFSYYEEEVFTAGVKLSFNTLEDNEKEFEVKAEEPMFNLIEMTEEDFNHLYEQVMDKIGYYEDLLNDFL